MRTIAALFVDARGCYANLPGVDVWDEERDARLYEGPHPVVAHPPCQRWGSLAYANYGRYGGEHLRPGNDGGCFASALRSVLRWGGILEHPAKSRAWAAYGLPAPLPGTWTPGAGGWSCEVWQSAYGHRANKATWLFCAGVELPDMHWERVPGTHQVGYADKRGKARNKPPLSKREANATPIEFRDVLIATARTAKE